MYKVKVWVRLADGTWHLFGWIQSLDRKCTGPESTAIPVAADNMDILMDLWHEPYWRLMQVE